MRISLRDKQYSFKPINKIENDGSTLGFCTDPNKPNRKIRVLKGIKDLQEMEVVIHELTHGLYWDLDEEIVEQTSADLTAALWKLGYRKDEEIYKKAINSSKNNAVIGKKSKKRNRKKKNK